MLFLRLCEQGLIKTSKCVHVRLRAWPQSDNLSNIIFNFILHKYDIISRNVKLANERDQAAK